jgi:peptidoglycan/LPS O-acetylase OafA/YrhL
MRRNSTPSQTPLPLSYFASLFYQHNMILGAASRILPPLWSLEIEFQFYLLAPFVLTWYARAKVVHRRLAAVIVIVLGIALASSPGLAHLLGPRLSLSVLGYIHFFGAGILASDIMFTRKPALSLGATYFAWPALQHCLPLRPSCRMARSMRRSTKAGCLRAFSRPIGVGCSAATRRNSSPPRPSR